MQMNDELNMDYVLGLKFTDMEGTECTIRSYLEAMLVALIEEGEGFSGKRPLGNSGWQYELYEPLIKNGLIEGAIDDMGYIDHVNVTEGDDILKAAVEYVFKER